MTLTIAELRERIKNASDSDTVHVELPGSGITDITDVDAGGSEVILHADDIDLCDEDAIITDGDFYEMWVHQNNFFRFKQGDLEIAIRPSSISYWTMHDRKTLTLYVEGVKQPMRLFGEMARTVHYCLASSTSTNPPRVFSIPGDNPVNLRLVEETVQGTCTK